MSVVWEIRAREARAAVLAAPHAVRRSGQHQRRLTRVHDDGEGLVIGQHVLPLAVDRVATEHAAPAGLIWAPDITGERGIEVG